MKGFHDVAFNSWSGFTYRISFNGWRKMTFTDLISDDFACQEITSGKDWNPNCLKCGLDIWELA